MLEKIGMGALVGFSSSLIGYFRKTPVPEFEAKKLIKTVIIGVVVGAAKPYYTEDVTVNFLETMGYTVVIDRIADLIWTRVKAAIKR